MKTLRIYKIMIKEKIKLSLEPKKLILHGKKILIFFIILLTIESCQQNQAKHDEKCYNCFNGITAFNIDSLPLFYIEYIFLNIRAKSIGEIANFKVIYYFGYVQRT